MKPGAALPLVLLGVACVLGIYLGNSSVLRPSSGPFTGGAQEGMPSDPERTKIGTKSGNGEEVRLGGLGEAVQKNVSAVPPLKTKPSQAYAPPDAQGVFNQVNAQKAPIGIVSAGAKLGPAQAPKGEPEATKILAVMEGDGSNFVLPAEQLGFAAAMDVTKNEMAVRNPLLDEQAKINALAQLTGAYAEKSKEASFLQGIARDLSQPESVRVGAFLKLADLGESYVSSFAQSTDATVRLEFEMLQLLRKHQVQERIPDGVLRAAVR
jgi:hypothetical protein